MQVYIAGSGKLALELRQRLVPAQGLSLARWDGVPAQGARSIVVHAGSGRELEAIAAFCADTGSVLLELSTGSALEGAAVQFPVVMCPNTNLLMLKFMRMLERSGGLFKGCDIQLTESHQASKTSVPGTAVQMAQALGVAEQAIVSVRDPAQQALACQIPAAHLGRHAFHRITLQDGPCTIAMETRVYGDAPYASGVQAILDAVHRQTLEPRTYGITEFIDRGWV